MGAMAWAQEPLQGKASSSKGEEKEPASEKSWEHLQEAYDAMQQCIAKVKEYSKDLMKLSMKSK
eukprot:1170695-Lingulodinium_polyedra.AAC.1